MGPSKHGVVMGSVTSFGKRAAAAIACGCLLALLVAAATPAVAGALASRFSIDEGAMYSRSLSVSVGDGGWSPFFRPGVVVWDGGSIVGGNGADPAFTFPAQTLSLVPHPCTSYLSITSAALIADMLTAAPAEVDARFRADADLDLCVVHAGGGDFLKGADPAAVIEGLKAYCVGRRAAGFRVVVLSVLPRSTSSAFEAARAAYNQLLRDTWPEFADGFADIAADPRIGDAGDNLNRQFYGSDAVHPNNAGNAVMATVAAPVIDGLDWRSSGTEMRLRDPAQAWGAWQPYAAKSSFRLPGGEGIRTVEAEFRENGGPAVPVLDSIFVDTVKPTTFTGGDVTARQGRSVILAYKVKDLAPCGPTANVVVRITDSSGAVVKQLSLGRRAVNERLTTTIACWLRKGRYRYTICANDTAGNAQQVAGSAWLRVR
ncbi:MAG TPA: hypothetical protein VIL79_10405 [Thermoleophilia bacterium]